MRFLPGQSGNPSGRTPGVRGGRTHALMTLDRMLAKPANQAFLAKALEEELRKNPLRFFRSIIMPLIPHETRTAIEQAGVVGWRSLVSSSITGAGLQSDAGGGDVSAALPAQPAAPVLEEKNGP